MYSRLGISTCGAAAAAHNIISGNGGSGVSIYGADARGNKVVGNYVGTDKNGIADLGNSSVGVYIYDAANSTIGGTLPGTANLIALNDGPGASSTASPTRPSASSSSPTPRAPTRARSS